MEFFLGGTSPDGFASRFDEILADTGRRSYIIKGGPGCGKSTLMKRLAEAFPEEEKDFFHCSSDPASLDAVVFRERPVTLVDGTPPHVFEPEYPGAVQQILDLGTCWDTSLLRTRKDEIIAASTDCARCHASCRRFVTALAAVAEDTCGIGRAALDTEKLEGFSSRLAAKVLPKKREDSYAKIEYRQLSALTPEGYMTYLPEGYTVYLLNDSCYAGSDLFLRHFADIVQTRGYTVYVSVCNLLGSEAFEHLLIPELRLAFLTASPINEIVVPNNLPVNFRRFYNKTVLREKKARLRFNEKAALELRDEAANALRSALAEHNRLEEYYIEAVDHDALNRVLYTMISCIKSL